MNRDLFYATGFRKRAERELGINYANVESAFLELCVVSKNKPNLDLKRDRERLGRTVYRRILKCPATPEWLQKFEEYMVSIRGVRQRRAEAKWREPNRSLENRLAKYKKRLLSQIFRSCHPVHKCSNVIVQFSPEGKVHVSVNAHKEWRKYGRHFHRVTSSVTCQITVPSEWLEWRRRGLASYHGGLVLSVKHKGDDRYELVVTHQSHGYNVTTREEYVRLTERGWERRRRPSMMDENEPSLGKNESNLSMEVSA